MITPFFRFVLAAALLLGGCASSDFAGERNRESPPKTKKAPAADATEPSDPDRSGDSRPKQPPKQPPKADDDHAKDDEPEKDEPEKDEPKKDEPRRNGGHDVPDGLEDCFTDDFMKTQTVRASGSCTMESGASPLPPSIDVEIFQRETSMAKALKKSGQAISCTRAKAQVLGAFGKVDVTMLVLVPDCKTGKGTLTWATLQTANYDPSFVFAAKSWLDALERNQVTVELDAVLGPDGGTAREAFCAAAPSSPEDACPSPYIFQP